MLCCLVAPHIMERVNQHFVYIIFMFCFLIAQITKFSYNGVGVNGWLLDEIGLNESYRVRHLSTHFSRVFLSISVESGTFPTLIEAQWPVSYLPMRSLIFPHVGTHANGNHEDCTHIQQAHWSQVDGLSRLWVMDFGWQDANGTQLCPPKLLVFDLIRNNIEVLRIDCGRHITTKTPSELIVKLGPKLTSCELERHIFFVIQNNAYILAYDILEQTWHKRKLSCNKYATVPQTLPIKAVDFAFGPRGELVISDYDGELYSTTTALSKVNTLDNDNDNDNVTANNIKLTHLGSLLGPSRDMMFDYLGALFYVVPKFGTVVRCAQISNLTAEGNEVIYMTSKNIQQIFFGFESSVWVLTDRLLKPNDMCFPGLL